MSRQSKWRELTSARVIKPGELRRAARASNARLIGVAGFSGAWRHPDVETSARRVLFELFAEASSDTDRPVWCVSGATNQGVPKLAYEVAEELELQRVGVSAEAARGYPLASMHVLVIVGKRFGDESQVFVDLCERIWLLGGGPQSERETRLTHAAGKPVLLIRGFGGAADRLELTGAGVRERP